MKTSSLIAISTFAACLVLSQCAHTATAPAPEAEAEADHGPHELKWVQVPLRTAEQKARGYAGGETGQMGYCAAISEEDPNYLAIAIDTAAVYISRNGARSWELKRRGIMSNGVQSVAFDPMNHNVLWAAGLKSATGVAEPSDPAADGIYLTRDCGESWQLIRNAIFVRRQAQNEYFAFDTESFDGTQCRTLYAATHSEGLLKTTDAGAHWKVLGFQDQLINAVVLHPVNHRLLFVAADTGLYRSDDAGESFRRIGGGLPAGAAILGFAANSKDQDILHVALGADGIWRSRDGGKSFTRTMDGIPEWAIREKWPWLRLCISPADPRRLYADARMGGAFPYWSDDGGSRWNAPVKREPAFFDVNPADPVHWDPEGFVAHPREPKVAFHITPIRKTTDGGRTWLYASDGVSGFRRNFRTTVAFHPTNPQELVLFHGDWGSAHTTDGGDTFVLCPPPRQSELGSFNMPVGAYEPVPGSRKIISAIGGSSQESGIQRICVTTDNCRSWKIQKGTEGDYRFLAFHPQQPKIVYAGRANDSLRSRDGGATWTRLPYPIRTMCAGNGDIVYAPRETATKGQWEVLRSEDQGETWLPLPGRVHTWDFREMDVDPRDPDRLYAASSFGVSVFDGRGWSMRNERHGLEKNFFGDLSFIPIAVDPTRPEVIYAGQNESWRGISAGIFRSTDSGQSWENVSLNLGPELTVWAISVSPHDGTVWLATDYGNWKLPPGPYKSPGSIDPR